MLTCEDICARVKRRITFLVVDDQSNRRVVEQSAHEDVAVRIVVVRDTRS